MTSQSSTRLRDWSIVGIATIIGLLLRYRIAFGGSIWADEGSFLNVLAAPTWRAMIDFLRIHESHPPLFYLLMRMWSQTAGASDSILMVVPILLGAAIVPAIFIAGRELFTERSGVIAACMAALAPQLTEHASQIRPYGLLSLCALGSVAALAICITAPTRRAWVLYVASTATMLYTHNWAWMIVAGELGAALVLLRHLSPDLQHRSIRTAMLAWILILALYSPWIPSFIFQSEHAGHGALAIEGVVEYVGYFVFSVHRILESLLIGRLWEKQTVAIVELMVATIALGLTTAFYKQGDPSSERELLLRRAQFVLHVAIFALTAALIVSPFNNLILPRSVATVILMLLLASAYWIHKILLTRASRGEAQLAAVVFSFALIAAAFETAALVVRPRSNVGQIADAVKLNAQPNDMLIVAPEWFAASFDHYFPPSIEQIDYPYDGRSGMIDFTHTWAPRSHSTAVLNVEKRIIDARKDNRRIWFVFERRYLRTYTPQELRKAYRHKQARVFRVQDLKRIRATLDNLYAGPRKIFEARRPLPINDDLIAYLYAP